MMSFREDPNATLKFNETKPAHCPGFLSARQIMDQHSLLNIIAHIRRNCECEGQVDQLFTAISEHTPDQSIFGAKDRLRVDTGPQTPHLPTNQDSGSTAQSAADQRATEIKAQEVGATKYILKIRELKIVMQRLKNQVSTLREEKLEMGGELLDHQALESKIYEINVECVGLREAPRATKNALSKIMGEKHEKLDGV